MAMIVKAGRPDPTRAVLDPANSAGTFIYLFYFISVIIFKKM